MPFNLTHQAIIDIILLILIVIFHELGHYAVSKKKRMFRKFGFQFPFIYVESDIDKGTLIDLFDINLAGIITGLPLIVFTSKPWLYLIFYVGASVKDIINIIIIAIIIATEPSVKHIPLAILKKKLSRK